MHQLNTAPTEAAVVASLARESLAPLFKQPSDHGTAAPLVVFPTQNKVESLERFMPRPVRKRAAVQVKDHDSFIDYVKRHQEGGTILFADLDTAGASFTAIMDYHLPNGGSAETGLTVGEPGWAAHTCKLTMHHSPEWLAWTAKDGSPFKQAEFAVFLEDNRLDILRPDAGEIIDIAKSLEATTGSKFESAIRLDNGDRKFKYEVQTSARAGEKGELTIPDKFTLKLPVFINGEQQELEAFFRYRITGSGELVLFYNLIRPHKVVELAVEKARNAIEGETKLQVHHGSASVPSIG